MSGDKFDKIIDLIDSIILVFFEKWAIYLFMTLLFLTGFVLGVIATYDNSPNSETAFGSNSSLTTITGNIISPKTSSDVNSPHDWIKEEQIHVYNDRIVIDLAEAEWAKFTDTNSMDPVLDHGSNAIEIIPKNESDIHVGDIISFNSEYATGTIIHRAIEIGHDQDGWYVKTKGDNNKYADPGKVRFLQIRRIVVAVIY